jgi:aerobic carbon-monoxide dehydrogenase medium subunit
VKPAPFKYFAPRSSDEALALLAEYGADAKPLAGGQSLIPAMNFRLAAPAVLVDLNRITSLSYVRQDAQDLRIGAMTRHRVVEHDETIRRLAPLLSMTMPFVAHGAIRTRGTLGGSLAHADPAAELPAVMLALDARCVLTSLEGTRSLAADDFFTGLFSTALAPGELLSEVAIPARTSGTGFAFEEISRRHGDYALAGAAAAVSLENDRCTRVRVALLSVGDRPLLAERVSRALVGEAPSAGAIRAAAEDAAAHDLDPPSDIHASSDYRRHLASVLIRRVLTRAADAARGGVEESHGR